MTEAIGGNAQAVTAFIARWQDSGAAERANFQLFLSELCDLLGVARPEPAKPNESDNAYVFERGVTFRFADGSTSPGRIDLYKRGCFVLEAKQGSDQERAAQLALFGGPAKNPRSARPCAVRQRGMKRWCAPAPRQWPMPRHCPMTRDGRRS